MVIEITKDVLENLYLRKKTEFERLSYLISKNIGENIFALKSTQNFIYLNYQACLFLNEKYESKELIKYFDNLQGILASVSKLERIVVVFSASAANQMEIEYEYELISELLIKPIKVILENINDKKIYDIIIKSYMSYEKNLRVNLEYQNGNGNQTAKTLEENLRERKISVVITDCDQKYYGEENRSSTPAKIKSVFERNIFLCKHIAIEYKNVEGLIPYKFVIENLESKIKTSFDQVYKTSKDKEWLNFFDFKKGIMKNLKSESEGGIVSSSLSWWNSKVELDICILEFANQIETQDIFRSGIPSSIMQKPMDDIIFKSKSSEEQKKEYRRISSLIYPWIISNDYVTV